MSNVKYGNIREKLSNFFIDNKFSSIGILVDENTIKLCYPIVKDCIPTHKLVKIDSGETNKTISTCELIWSEMTNYKFDRNSLLINLGGGVIGDMGGFCASTFKRGISFINIPTTLLAMVDASVGGKTGVDFNDFKNHIGLFSETRTVFIDSIFLQTLEKRQLISGSAELIKYGLISNLNLDLIFSSIERNEFSQSLIQESVKFKESVVLSDYKEKGERKTLNFGHTIGHAIESYFLNKEGLLHGEAIIVGMICELFLSIKKLGLDSQVADNIINKLLSVYSFRKMHRDEREAITELSLQDKKNNKGKIKCVLLESVGNAKTDIEVTSQEVMDSLKFYNSLV